MKKDLVSLLKFELDLLEQATDYLRLSYQNCSLITNNKDFFQSYLIEIEALTSRFARVSDILIQKIFRLISEIDLEKTGTIRDLIQGAEKKEIIANAENQILIRQLRKDIAHVYLNEALLDIFQQVMKFCPLLLEDIDTTKKYTQKFLTK